MLRVLKFAEEQWPWMAHLDLRGLPREPAGGQAGVGRKQSQHEASLSCRQVSRYCLISLLCVTSVIPRRRLSRSLHV